MSNARRSKAQAASEAAQRGRTSNREGHAFEERVAELYRLMRYDVELGREFSSRQVDILLHGRFGDLTIHRAIECKLGLVRADEIDAFLIKLRLVRREYPDATGTIVSATSFTDAVASQAAAEGIQLVLHRDLAARLIDGHTYATQLIREIESNERYSLNLYVEPTIGFDSTSEGTAAFKAIAEWLSDSTWSHLTVLGDVGTGKSFLSRMIAYRLAKDFLERPFERPLPVRIDLRNADREFSLEGLVLTHFARSGLPGVTFDVFQYALAEGRLVLLLDGFDEMAVRVTPEITASNFHELSRCVTGRAKVLLTCRTHYFRSRSEEEEVILGGDTRYTSAVARELYWELIARHGFKIAYLRPFTINQIEEYVSRAKGSSAKKAMQRVKSTYNLLELSQRPLLLDMVIRCIDAVGSGEINVASLYKLSTDAWVHREQWRGLLSAPEKVSFVVGLSRALWDEGSDSIHYSRLGDYVQKTLAHKIHDPRQFVELDNEIRTSTFLTRDEGGSYGFAHDSFAEFFFAQYLV